MNRRAIMASMAAVAVTGSAAAQDATPEPEHKPGSLMRQYLNDVWINRNADAIADYFDADAFNLLDIQREHRIAIDGMDEDRPLRIREITSDARVAMAFCRMFLADEGAHDMFMIVRLGSSGLIEAYRWMAQPEL